MVKLFESVTGTPLSDAQRQALVQGAGEADIVFSGIEDTMINACEQTRATAQRLNSNDYRQAAYLNAIEKITGSYEATGLMFT